MAHMKKDVKGRQQKMSQAEIMALRGKKARPGAAKVAARKARRERRRATEERARAERARIDAIWSKYEEVAKSEAEV